MLGGGTANYESKDVGPAVIQTVCYHSINVFF